MRNKQNIRFLIVVLLHIIGLLTVLLISINSGYISLTPKETLKTLFGQGTEQQELILFSFRLPRLILAMLVGAGLSVSGCVFQAVSKNSLASPSLLGINAGGGLSVLLFIYLTPVNTLIGIFTLPVISIIGASITALCIYRLSHKKEEAISPIRLVLIGIGVSAGIQAIELILTTRLSPEKFNRVNIWTIGSLFGSNWNYIIALLPWVCIIIPYFLYHSRKLNILRLSDEVSVGLGANLKRERFIFLMMAVALAGASIAVGGAIGFVGLICPHLTRKLVGPRHEKVIPVATLSGALLLSTVDLISRTIVQPNEIPLGIVVSIVGAPYFLYLLMRAD